MIILQVPRGLVTGLGFGIVGVAFWILGIAVFYWLVKRYGPNAGAENGS